MQRRVNTLLAQFTSKDNAGFLFDCLNNNDPRILSYLKEHFMGSLKEFANQTWHEYTNSAPLPGVTLLDELNALNKAFLNYQRGQINIHVRVEEAPAFMLTDGQPTSRHGKKHFNMSADNILKTWQSTNSRGVQSREDRMGRQVSNQGGQMESGVMFCDQSELGVNQHEEMLLNNSYIKALNQGAPAHTYAAFGNADIDVDNRLLSRRIFRNNEAGVENGIPRYESRLYRRNLERDITETLPGDSHGFKQRGYDMSDLHRRIDSRKHIPEAKTKMKLQSSEFVDDERYC